MGWSTNVIDALAAAKEQAMRFEEAWRWALECYPPRGRDLGPSAPSLLDEDESPVDFLHRVAADAWEGRRPVLRHLVNAMELVEQTDEPRVVAGRHLAAGDA